jgi:hypothetical protein
MNQEVELTVRILHSYEFTTTQGLSDQEAQDEVGNLKGGKA